MGTGFCIVRVKKLKTAGNLGGSLDHTFRERRTPNADTEKAKNNQFLGAKNTDQAMAKYREIIGKLARKPRPDAVQCLEYFIGFSPEALAKNADIAAFFNNALKKLREKHGVKNVILTAVHFDEKTPHMVVYAVPVDERGRLNAKFFTGGRAKLSKLQDEIYEAAGRPAGLDRGLKGSTAKHEEISAWYKKVKDIAKLIDPPKREPGENFDIWLKRYRQQLEPLCGLAASADRLAKRNRELEAAVQKMGGDLKAQHDFTNGLTPDQIQQIADLRSQFLATNRRTNTRSGGRSI